MIHATAPQETGHVLLAGTEGAYPQVDGSILCLAPAESASFRGPKARARALKWCAERGIHPGAYAPKCPDRTAGLKTVLDFFENKSR